MTLTFEIGKAYKRRDGVRCVFEKDDGHGSLPLMFRAQNGTFFTRKDGSYGYLDGSHFDIIGPWEDEAEKSELVWWVVEAIGPSSGMDMLTFSNKEDAFSAARNSATKKPGASFYVLRAVKKFTATTTIQEEDV